MLYGVRIFFFSAASTTRSSCVDWIYEQSKHWSKKCQQLCDALISETRLSFLTQHDGPHNVDQGGALPCSKYISIDCRSFPTLHYSTRNGLGAMMDGASCTPLLRTTRGIGSTRVLAFFNELIIYAT